VIILSPIVIIFDSKKVVNIYLHAKDIDSKINK